MEWIFWLFETDMDDKDLLTVFDAIISDGKIVLSSAVLYLLLLLMSMKIAIMTCHTI